MFMVKKVLYHDFFYQNIFVFTDKIWMCNVAHTFFPSLQSIIYSLFKKTLNKKKDWINCIMESTSYQDLDNARHVENIERNWSSYYFWLIKVSTTCKIKFITLKWQKFIKSYEFHICTWGVQAKPWLIRTTSSLICVPFIWKTLFSICVKSNELQSVFFLCNIARIIIHYDFRSMFQFFQWKFNKLAIATTTKMN